MIVSYEDANSRCYLEAKRVYMIRTFGKVTSIEVYTTDKEHDEPFVIINGGESLTIYGIGDREVVLYT